MPASKVGSTRRRWNWLLEMGDAGAAVKQQVWDEDETEMQAVRLGPTFVGRLAASVLDVVEKLLVWSCWKSQFPDYYLSGNFAPTDEFKPVSDLPVTGSLPECVKGEFVRVGPNPRFNPVAGYHWFDGDGMIHAVRFKGGKASYVARYVQTSRLKQETYYGAAKFVKIGDMKGKFGLMSLLLAKLREKLGVLDLSKGCGTGNTALIYHNGRLLALHEGDKPYVVRMLEDGDLQTLGLLDYDSRLNHSFTAHPKIDAVTGELFTFGYSLEKSPYVTYRVVSKDGVMADPVPISVPQPIMMHDFAITENYAIFMDLPLLFQPKAMAKKGFVFQFDGTKNSRFGILPRYAKNESHIRWFELPACVIFHNVNAWEEGDEILLYACRLDKIDLGVTSDKTGSVADNVNELYEFRFNLKDGGASQKRLGDFRGDFPRINENYVGRKQQYSYISVFTNKNTISGIVKIDLFDEPQIGRDLEIDKNIKGVFKYGDKRYGSEAVFVPNPGGKEEDDGYLISIVYDEHLERSEVVVIDAKTMKPDPVAVVHLPRKVPYGFHAHFVSEEQLKSQK